MVAAILNDNDETLTSRLTDCLRRLSLVTKSMSVLNIQRIDEIQDELEVLYTKHGRIIGRFLHRKKLANLTGEYEMRVMLNTHLRRIINAIKLYDESPNVDERYASARLVREVLEENDQHVLKMIDRGYDIMYHPPGYESKDAVKLKGGTMLA